jgi:hypothetical protein
VKLNHIIMLFRDGCQVGSPLESLSVTVHRVKIASNNFENVDMARFGSQMKKKCSHSLGCIINVSEFGIDR